MEHQQVRRRLGEAKWRELLSRFDAGRDTVEAFCKREGVAKSSFHRWQSLMAAGAPVARAARRGPQPRQAGFVDLGMLSLPSATSGGTGSTGSTGRAGRLELTLDLGGGVTLRVARG